MEHQSQRAYGPDLGWPRSCLKASITQRVVAQPGATFGWHSHPGENVNVVVQGTVTLYHDEDCVNGVAYPAGSAVPPDPDQVQLARNLTRRRRSSVRHLLRAEDDADARGAG